MLHCITVLNRSECMGHTGVKASFSAALSVAAWRLDTKITRNNRQATEPFLCALATGTTGKKSVSGSF
jgi:hypothetical protein